MLTFEAESLGHLYRRLTFVTRGTIRIVIYPVFPTDSDAPKVVEWLKSPR